MPSVQGPSLQRIPRDHVNEIIQAIKDDGGCIIKGFTTVDAVDRVNSDTKPWLEKDKPWKGDLFPPETRRCCRLVARSRTVREQWVIDPLISKLLEILVDKTTSNYYGTTRHTYTSTAIVDTALTMEVNPGGKAQRLHRDDKNHHVDHLDQTKTGYRVGSDVSMGFLIPGTETTYENGATMVVPGSHLWDDERAPTMEDGICYATMQKGDALAFLGSVYHAGGGNITKDWKRPMHSLFFCRGYLRTEENVYLTTPAEEVLSWPFEVQQRMGYTTSSPNIGFTDFVQPYKFLAGYDQPEDPDPSQEVGRKEIAV